jgi:hypothetical protein
MTASPEEQPCRARRSQRSSRRIATAPAFAGPPTPSKHDHILRRHAPVSPVAATSITGCRLPRRSGHLIAVGARGAPFRPSRASDSGRVTWARSWRSTSRAPPRRSSSTARSTRTRKSPSAGHRAARASRFLDPVPGGTWLTASTPCGSCMPKRSWVCSEDRPRSPESQSPWFPVDRRYFHPSGWPARATTSSPPGRRSRGLDQRPIG